MTPFGTVLQFDKEVITSEKKSSSKKARKSTDFDSFLMGLDKKLTRKPVKKRSEPEAKISTDKPTTSKAVENNYNLAQNTDFDNFLNGLDTKPKTSKTKQAVSNTNATKPNTSQPTITSKSVVNKINSDPLKVNYI